MRFLPEPPEPTTDCWDCGTTGTVVEPAPDPTLYGTEHPCPTCRGFGMV